MLLYRKSGNIYRFIPDIITISRMLWGYMLVKSLITSEDVMFWIFLVLTILSDGLDGFLARRLKVVSDIGKVLDHITDKVLTLVVVFFLCKIYSLFWWVFYLLFAREFITSVVAIGIKIRRGNFPSSNPLGKVFGLLAILTLISYDYNLTVKNWILGITIIFMAISSLANLRAVFKHL